ncbi:MAG: helix-turn-helix transcriptional regulator [Clostridia bacterium]|nr:helix-turn-helix transcriptional regulator [Clostridia bacterium]
MELNLSENIREMRKARGITQTELAQSLSVTPQSVSRWETGQAYPDVVLLPRIAKYFDVTLDELMLGLESSLTIYRKEFAEASKAVHSENTLENRKRVCDILEVLTREKPREYMVLYFTNLLVMKNEYDNVSESRLDDLREQLCEMLNQLPVGVRCVSLVNIIRNEDEDKLDIWKSFCSEGYAFTTWDDYLLQRYAWNEDTEKWSRVRQNATYQLVSKLINLLSEESRGACGNMQSCFLPNPSEYYRSCLQVINAFSKSENDLLLPLRIQIEFGLARALFMEGEKEEGFSCLERTQKYIESLWKAREGAPLLGSSPFMDTLSCEVHDDEAVICMLNVWKYDSCLEFDAVRDDPRFIKFFDYVNGLFPNTRGFVTVKDGKDIPYDESEFARLVDIANGELEKKNGTYMTQAVVFRTAKGSIYKTVISDTQADVESDLLLKEMRQSGDTHIESVVCCWEGGCVDMPSYELRQKLISLDRRNKDAAVLLQGLDRYIVKELEKLLPPKNKS